jgi:hypothetical protein
MEATNQLIAGFRTVAGILLGSRRVPNRHLPPGARAKRSTGVRMAPLFAGAPRH